MGSRVLLLGRHAMLVLPAVVMATVCAAPLHAQEQEAAEPMLSIEAMKLGSGVENRELVAEATTFNLNDKVYLWMRVVGGPSDPITVTWALGDLSYSIDLQIGGSPWRTWAYKTAWKPGDWSVTVTDSDGNELKSLAFVVAESREEDSARR